MLFYFASTGVFILRDARRPACDLFYGFFVTALSGKELAWILSTSTDVVDRSEMQLPALRQRAAVGYASQKARVADGVDADVWARTLGFPTVKSCSRA
jgi:hypothetical protein